MKYDSNVFSIICRCNDPVYSFNEDDAALNKHRAEADESGYDAEMEFYMWIYGICIKVYFNLYGIDYTILSLHKNVDAMKLTAILDAITITHKWFEDKYLDDISEAFYDKVENELGQLIYNNILRHRQ